MSIKLFSIKNEIIENVKINDELILNMYFLKYKVPSKQDDKNLDIDKIKEKISKIKSHIPLYDIFTKNVYVIQKRNVYYRVVKNDYRFPDKLIIKDMEELRKSMKSKLKINPNLVSDKIFMRKIRKLDLALNFMDNYDLDILKTTYLDIFYRYSPEISNSTFTCERKSFLTHKSHLKPYYTRDEIIKLALNMESIKLGNVDYDEYKDNLEKEEYDNLCRLVQKNDISSKILLNHQNYIIKNNLVGLVQYYTIQGSYFMNQYLRGFTKYEYKNDYLENNILKMWKLVLESPEFDNDYILYRFVSNDDYISHLNIGDVFIEKGFTSTTRDPFYRTDLYKFGFILIKIRIPKNIKGIGLCLETLSHFPEEEEIILAPNVHLKLIGKDSSTVYYHPDKEFTSKVNKRYEFEFVKNGEVKFMDRNIYERKTKTVNFLEIPKFNTLSINEKIKIFVNKYFDPMNRIKVKIGEQEFFVKGEYYDSTSVYKPMYSITTNEGFSLYSIYKGYMLFMIEIGEDIEKGVNIIKVNYFTKYSSINREKILGDDNFLKFISSIGYFFDVANIVIFSDYMSCDNNAIKTISIQREFSKDNNSINNPINNISDDIIQGGSYNVDIYNYLKNKTKRYSNTNALNIELKPYFNYEDLDKLKTINPGEILNKTDRDEIYQIYKKTYLFESKKNNLAHFFVWMVDNKCYLMDIFIDKFTRYYGKNNPFIKDYYVLDGNVYLYNRMLISSYSRFIKLNYDEERNLLILPKNEYRIER
jgi:hypothetical protein